jgi:hypothetical protein
VRPSCSSRYQRPAQTPAKHKTPSLLPPNVASPHCTLHTAHACHRRRLALLALPCLTNLTNPFTSPISPPHLLHPTNPPPLATDRAYPSHTQTNSPSPSVRRSFSEPSPTTPGCPVCQLPEPTNWQCFTPNVCHFHVASVPVRILKHQWAHPQCISSLLDDNAWADRIPSIQALAALHCVTQTERTPVLAISFDIWINMTPGCQMSGCGASALVDKAGAIVIIKRRVPLPYPDPTPISCTLPNLSRTPRRRCAILSRGSL